MQRFSLEGAQRILVTGNAGAGKTWVASQLAECTAIPYVGLDLIVWKPGWQVTPEAERRVRISEIAAGLAWIVDGVSIVILDAADVVVFLDYSRRTCFFRALRRNIPYLFRSRPGLPGSCPEIRIIPTLLKIIWRFPTRVRPTILDACARGEKRLIHIRNDGDLRHFLSASAAGRTR